MVEIDANLLKPEDMMKIVETLQKQNKEAAEKLAKQQAEFDQKMKVMAEQIAMHKETLDKVRFPGINKAELPANSLIAETLGIDPSELDFYLEKYPNKYLLRVEGASSAQIQSLKVQLKDAEVDISGNSIIELIEDQYEIFWSVYTGSATIDDKFMENMEKAKAAFLKMKEQYMIEKKYLADISLIQDCRMSAYLHYRDTENSDNELTTKIPDKEQDPEITNMKQIIEAMQKKLEMMDKEKKESDMKVAESIQEKDQKALSSIGEGDVPKPPPEEEQAEESPEPAEEQTTEDEKPRRGRPAKK